MKAKINRTSKPMSKTPIEVGGWYWVTGPSDMPTLCVCARVGMDVVALIDIEGNCNRWDEATSIDALRVKAIQWSVVPAKVTINAE